MERVKTLHEQARILRMLATSFRDAPALSGDLLILAKRCDELAAEADREIKERLSQPIGGVASG